MTLMITEKRDVQFGKEVILTAWNNNRLLALEGKIGALFTIIPFLEVQLERAITAELNLL